MRPLAEIIIHCSATRPNWMSESRVNRKIDEMRRWHVQGNGWRDIGYHFAIDRNGDTGIGRPIGEVGAHVRGHNTGTIGICLLGGHGASADDQFSDHFTQAQDSALRDLIDELKRDFPTINRVTGHNEYAAKACPGFRVNLWLPKGASTPKARPTFWVRFMKLFQKR